jgi:hypothetical protein
MGDKATVVMAKKYNLGEVALGVASTVGMWLGVLGVADVLNPTSSPKGVFLDDKRMEERILIGTGAGLTVLSYALKPLVK